MLIFFVSFVGEFQRDRVESAIQQYNLTKCSGEKYKTKESLVAAIKAKLDKSGRATAS